MVEPVRQTHRLSLSAWVVLICSLWTCLHVGWQLYSIVHAPRGCLMSHMYPSYRDTGLKEQRGSYRLYQYEEQINHRGIAAPVYAGLVALVSRCIMTLFCRTLITRLLGTVAVVIAVTTSHVQSRCKFELLCTNIISPRQRRKLSTSMLRMQNYHNSRTLPCKVSLSRSICCTRKKLRASQVMMARQYSHAAHNIFSQTMVGGCRFALLPPRPHVKYKQQIAGWLCKYHWHGTVLTSKRILRPSMGLCWWVCHHIMCI